MPRQQGFSLIELLVTVAVVGILTAIAVPQLARARLSSNEASAAAALRAISSSQANYAATCGAGGFATDLADLVKAPSPGAPGFISPDFAVNGVEKSGYVFRLTRNDSADTVDVVTPSCNAAALPRATSFFASAQPTVPGRSGSRHFATDTPGTIYQDEVAIANPVPPGTPTLQ